jgi:hypothetical protein
MESKEKFIRASKETVEYICSTVKGINRKTFVTTRTVNHALSFQSNSETAKRIRKIALQRGAQIYENITHQLKIKNY